MMASVVAPQSELSCASVPAYFAEYSSEVYFCEVAPRRHWAKVVEGVPYFWMWSWNTVVTRWWHESRATFQFEEEELPPHRAGSCRAAGCSGVRGVR